MNVRRMFVMLTPIVKIHLDLILARVKLDMKETEMFVKTLMNVSKIRFVHFMLVVKILLDHTSVLATMVFGLKIKYVRTLMNV